MPHSVRLQRVRALAAAVLLLAVPARGELLVNGTFDTNIDGWSDPTPFPQTVISWSAFDASLNPASGSLSVRTNMDDANLDGPWQCVETTAGAHELSAMAKVELGMKVDPFVEMTLDFFAAPDCTGSPIGVGADDVAINAGVWEPLSVPADAPSGTHGARVRFLVGGTYDLVSDVVLFDDASLAPEPDGLALGLVTLGALGALARRRK